MNIRNLHSWNVKLEEAVIIQKFLASRVIRSGSYFVPRLIAGLDVSVNKNNQAKAAAVVLNYPELEVIEIAIAEGVATFPYIPGLLSFREVPLTLEACRKIQSSPELVLVDGQGIAHPRYVGLASHLGLFLEVPTIGCAKSHLTGQYEMPGLNPGDSSLIRDRMGEIIGAALRTKKAVKPVYLSIGHLIDLPTSIHWVLQCCRGYRLPEPTRLAHLTCQKTGLSGNAFLK